MLGAPLMHDFAVISLSDRLTPMETIWKRLELAVEGDFVICLYNPSSKARGDYLAMACDRLLARCSGDRICGIVRNIGREGQEYRVMTPSGAAGLEGGHVHHRCLWGIPKPAASGTIW